MAAPGYTVIYMRIVLTGGGTAGHFIPFEPLIEALRTQYLEQKTSIPSRCDPTEFKLYFLGITDAETRRFFNRYDVAVHHVPSGKLRRYVSHLTLPDMLFRLPLGILKALWLMWHIMPDAVLSKGGYGSVPVLFAAFVFRIPFLLHESDAVVGLANRLVARVAAVVTVGFSVTKQEMERYAGKTFLTGTPVRSRFGALSQADAKRNFNFAAAEPVVLVLGGSQGAQQINEALLNVLPDLILSCGIIHLTGKQHFTNITAVARDLLQASSRRDYYKPQPYLEDTIADAMTAADVVVSRGGATTLAELTRLHKPTLIIPLESAANDHQRRNAQEYERVGAARVLDPSNMGRNLFLRSVTDMLNNEQLRRQLTDRIAQLDHPNAARDIAHLAFSLAIGLLPTLPNQHA